MALQYPSTSTEVKNLVKTYFKDGYNSDEIIGFLMLNHGIILSVSTLKRIKRKLHLRRNKCESPMSTIINKIQSLHRNGYINVGYKTMWKILNIMHGVRATQETVRLCLSVIDPEGVDMRARHGLRRRMYCNKGPNYLVHVDGYDKLKPFGIAIHGAIDGFSRKVLWMKAGHSNKNPKYIARFYLNFILEYKRIPHMIRADAGTENVIIQDLQRALRSNHGDNMSGRRSFQTGRSTANQRIERLWADVSQSFTRFWKNHFQDFRDSGLFSDADPLHVECLRFCFLPVIQDHLDAFTRWWNLHRIRQQARTEMPSGIPNLLYFQPEIFGARDYSHDLPCDDDTITDILYEYSEEFPLRGCADQFLRIVEFITGLDRNNLPRPKTYGEAKKLFSDLCELFSLMDNQQ